MDKILKYASVIRNNWKKSTLACVLVGYGAKYGHDQYEIQNMMRELCKEAALIGEAPAGMETDASQIAVILNPAANRRSAKKNYEKYCAPLLHLSGAYVTVVETTHEGHAKKISDELDPKTTAILVAGGDGTLSETVTGLMRSHSETLQVPVGILPLGRYNTLATYLFGSTCSDVEKMATATMSVIRGRTKKLNTYRVETLDGSSEKAVYGVGWIEWGTWPWLKKRVKELWYFGGLKKHIPLIMNPEESAMKSTVCASLAYTAPCSGCSRCYDQRPDLKQPTDRQRVAHAGRWWSAFVKKSPSTTTSIDYKSIDNETCDAIERRVIRCTDVRLATDMINRVNTRDNLPSLHVNIGPSKRYQGELYREGLKYLNSEPIGFHESIEAKQIEITPDLDNSTFQKTEDEERSEVLLIDNEEFELRPIRVTVLPNSLTVFCQ